MTILDEERHARNAMIDAVNVLRRGIADETLEALARAVRGAALKLKMANISLVALCKKVKQHQDLTSEPDEVDFSAKGES